MNNIEDIEKDVWEVKALEFYIEPVLEPSAAVERLLESRHKRHVEAQSEMCKQMKDLNSEAETWILRNSAVLKMMLENLKNVIDVAENDLKSVEILELNKFHFVKAWKDVASLFFTRRDIVDIYCEKLMIIEHDRSDKVKLVFRDYMKKLNKISHYLPYEVQEYFEHEVLKYNQMLLNNIRCYANMHLHFIASGDNEYLEFRRRVNVLQYEWQEALKRDALKTFEDENATIDDNAEVSPEDEEAERLRAELSGPRNRTGLFQALMCRWIDRPNIPYTKENAQVWSADLLRTIMHMDKCARRIVFLYKRAVILVLLGLRMTLVTLELQFLAEHLSTSQDINEIHIIVTPIIKRVRKKKEDQISFNEGTWNEVMTRLMSSVDVTKNFLTMSANVWEQHFQRLDNCVKFVAFALDKKIDDNVKLIQNLEVKFNVELELLRQETNELKLKKALEKVNKCLDALRDGYDACYISEVEVLQNFPLLVEAELIVLAAETDLFTVKFQRESSISDLQDSQIELPILGSKERRKTLPREMIMCTLQLDAIENWKLGLWEEMRHYIAFNSGSVIYEAEKWVKTMSIQAEQRLQIKILLHMPRYQRVKLQVHNVRLAEVNLHTNRLTSHKLGIDTYGEDMTTNLTRLVDKQNDLTEDLLTNLQELEETGQDAIKSANVSVLIKKVDIEVEKLTSNIHRVMHEFHEECIHQVVWLRETNINFMKAITMFSEGGSFSFKEAQEFTNALSACAKQIDKHEGSITKEIDIQKQTLLKNLRTKSEKTRTILKYIYDDLLFGEKAVKLIKALQLTIKREVSSMKSDSKSLNHKISYIETVLNDKTLPFSSLTEKWNALLEHLRTRKDYLLTPTEEEMAPGTTNIQPAPKLTFTTFEIDPMRIKYLQKLEVDNRYNDYRELLFGSHTPPAEDDKFLSRVCRSLWNALGEMQEISRLFYTNKGGRAVVKTDMIQPTYDRFIDEILVKFKYYHVQCEEVWLDQVQEFLITITKTRQLANSYVRLTLEEFGNNKLQELTGMHSYFVHDLAIKSKEQEDSRSALDYKLMPLYGYPGNSQMLENLNTEVLSSFQQLVAEALDSFVTYKEQLSNVNGTYQPMLDETVEPLVYLTEQIFDPDWTPQLVQTLEEVCTNVLERKTGSEISTVRPVTLDSSQDNLVKQLIHDAVHNLTVNSCGSITDPFKGKPIPQLHKLSIDYSNVHAKCLLTRLDRLREETLRISQLDTEPSEFADDEAESREEDTDLPIMSAKELVNILKPLEIDELANNIAKEYNDCYSEFCHGLNKEVIKYKCISREWIKTWKINVKKVKELYTVTYDK